MSKEAFDAGGEYHNPGHHIPIKRWKSYDNWCLGLETHTEYGREVYKQVKETH